MSEDTTPASTAPAIVEPRFDRCPTCRDLVLVAFTADGQVLAEPYEWEPRAACPYCGHIAGRGHRRGQCPRCDSSGYIGEQRPTEKVLAIDVAWSDEGGVRLIGPNTPRRRGEGLYRLHDCQ